MVARGRSACAELHPDRSVYASDEGATRTPRRSGRSRSCPCRSGSGRSGRSWSSGRSSCRRREEGGEEGEEDGQREAGEVRRKGQDQGSVGWRGEPQIIKEVRGLLNLGLKESKTLVESVPVMLKENMPKKEAEELAAKLKALGAETAFE